MSTFEVVLALLLLATVLAGVARRARIPEPILLVLAGIVVGLLPGMPADGARARPRVPAVPAPDPVRRGLLHLDPRLQGEPAPDPPALGRARAVHDGRGRGGRAQGARPRPGRGLAAFAFGAIVSPPDAVAATAVFKRLGVPPPDGDDPRGREPGERRDGARSSSGRRSWRWPARSALVAASADFVVVGRRRHPDRARRRVDRGLVHDPDPATRTSGSCCHCSSRSLAYIPAEALGVSGVLPRSWSRASTPGASPPGRSTPPQRVEGIAAWNIVLFVVNGLVFMLIGLQLPVDPRGPRRLGAAAAPARRGDQPRPSSCTRFAWVFSTDVRVRAVPAAVPRPGPGAAAGAVVSDRELGRHARRRVARRGPRAARPPVPGARASSMFLTFAVILATLVVQGLDAAGPDQAASGSRPATAARRRSGRHGCWRRRPRSRGSTTLEGDFPGHLELIEHLREHVRPPRSSTSSPVEGQTIDEAEQELLEHRKIRRGRDRRRAGGGDPDARPRRASRTR